MANLNFKITFDLGPLLEISRGINAATFPLLNQTVRAIAQQTAIDWQKSVYHAKLRAGEKDAYAKTITWSMTGEFSAVIASDYKYAAEIEEGRPARDLKQMLNYSLKVRQGKGGTRYLYIPFRHNTPGSSALAGSMPNDIYSLAKKLAPSTITGQGQRKSGTGAMDIKTKGYLTVPQNTYKWGERLPAGLSAKMKPHHATDIHAGMYRFNTSTPGGGKSSQYLTFRTMSSKSSGWIIPAQPGQHIAKDVAQKMQPKASAAFAEAIKRSLAKAI
jgi:hypothetical protein